LVALSDPEGSTAFPPGVLARDTGTIISSFIPTYLGSYPTNQPDFYSYQHWFANYPDEVIVKVQQPLAGNSNFIALGNNSSSEAITLARLITTQSPIPMGISANIPPP
jgi:hypothetical protein